MGSDHRLPDAVSAGPVSAARALRPVLDGPILGEQNCQPQSGGRNVTSQSLGTMTARSPRLRALFRRSLLRLHPRAIAASPSLSTWASFVGRSLSIFALGPLVLRQFEPEQAALWFSFITIQALQLLLESGIGLTFMRAIGYALGGAQQVADLREREPGASNDGPNVDLLARVWGSMRRLYLLVGGSTFLLIGTVGMWSTSSTIAKMSVPTEGYIALMLFVAGAAFRARGGQHIAYLYGVGRIGMLRWLETIFWVVAFAASAVTLLLGGDLLALTIAYQTPLFINLVFNAILSQRHQQSFENFDHKSPYDASILKQLWPSFWRSSLGLLIYLAVIQGAGLYYAKIGEPATVASYLFAMSISRPMTQFAQVPLFTRLPILARLRAEGNGPEQVAQARAGMLASYCLLVVMILGIAGGLPLVERYFGGAGSMVPASLWAWIGIAAFLERIGSMHLQLYSTTNHIIWHWANGITGVIFVGLAALGLGPLGAYAFPVAQAGSLLLFYIPVSMWHAYRAFALPIPRFELETSFFPALVLLAYSLFVFCL